MALEEDGNRGHAAAHVDDGGAELFLVFAERGQPAGIGRELGADDVRAEDDAFTVTTEPKEFERIRDGLKKAGMPDPASAEVTMVPQNKTRLAGKEAESALKLLDILEDNDDVQNVYSNLDVDEATLAKLS